MIMIPIGHEAAGILFRESGHVHKTHAWDIKVHKRDGVDLRGDTRSCEDFRKLLTWLFPCTL